MNGAFFVPSWALAANDTDPDLADTLSLSNVVGSSGGSALAFGGALFFDDATLGGSFDYTVTDGYVVSGPATATVTNNAASSTVLNGTSGADILISTNGASALSGGGGQRHPDRQFRFARSDRRAAGDDIFAFEVVPDGTNAIADFNNTADADHVSISSGAFGGGLSAGMDPSLIFESSGDSLFLSSDSRLHYDTSTQTLLFSSDGTDASALVVAQFQSGVLLHAQDVLVV